MFFLVLCKSDKLKNKSIYPEIDNVCFSKIMFFLVLFFRLDGFLLLAFNPEIKDDYTI